MNININTWLSKYRILYVNILYFDIVYFSLYLSLKMAPLFLDRRRFFSMAFIIFLIWFKEFFPFGIYFSI